MSLVPYLMYVLFSWRLVCPHPPRDFHTYCFGTRANQVPTAVQRHRISFWVSVIAHLRFARACLLVDPMIQQCRINDLIVLSVLGFGFSCALLIRCLQHSNWSVWNNGLFKIPGKESQIQSDQEVNRKVSAGILSFLIPFSPLNLPVPLVPRDVLLIFPIWTPMFSSVEMRN